MAGSFGRRRRRNKFQSSGGSYEKNSIVISNKRRKRALLRRIARNQQVTKKKLEEEIQKHKKNNKLLSLDPHRKHGQQKRQPQNPVLDLRHVVEGEGEEEQEQDNPNSSHPSYKNHHQIQDPTFNVPLQFLQQQQHQPSYISLVDPPQVLQPPKKQSFFLPPPSPPSSSLEHARKMVERGNRQPPPTTETAASSRLGILRRGETVEGGGGGGGGYIVKSTGRKDRHSKVSTAKGLRDRRVRLSAHTAIQFYDVQDRLGYDRPSKAVDWLIKNSKSAIEKLDKLPAWNPTTTPPASNSTVQKEEEEEQQQQKQQINQNQNLNLRRRKLNEIASAVEGGSGRISEYQQQQLREEDNNNHNKYNSGFSGSGFLPYDADLANTIKSFFPMETATASFQNYSSTPPDLLSRTTSGTNNQQQQDLRLSLQSFQDPILLHQHHNQRRNQNHHLQEQVLLAGTTDLGFDGGSSGWSEQQHQQRMVGWNNVDAGGGGAHGGGFIFNAAAVPAVFSHGHYLCSQRGPLQSSNTPSIRAWIDPSTSSMMVDNHQPYLSSEAGSGTPINQSSMGIAIPTFGGFFSDFKVPARIQGEEEHDGVSDKPSSASSGSRH